MSYHRTSLKLQEPIDSQNFESKTKEFGLFVLVSVTDISKDLAFWKNFFANELNHANFELHYRCKFTNSLTLSFKNKPDAIKASRILCKMKHKTKMLWKKHVTGVSKLKYHLNPCGCKSKIITKSMVFLENGVQQCKDYFRIIRNKIKNLRIKTEKNGYFNKLKNLDDKLLLLREMDFSYQNHINILKTKIEEAASAQDVYSLRKNFVHECISFKTSLPIYGMKKEIIDVIGHHPATIVMAEATSGKSTELPHYISRSSYGNGTVISIQPCKSSAINAAKSVCKQMGSILGELAGYDVGSDRKYNMNTKIIYMTDYALLQICIQNKALYGVSCVIIDEVHEHTLYTDILLGMMKQCLKAREEFRVIVTPATTNVNIFMHFFHFPKSALVHVPSKVYLVEDQWHNTNVTVQHGFNFPVICDKKTNKMLKTNIPTFLLKICELGICPHEFDFIEPPSPEAISKSMESLELLGLVLNGKLTDLGKKVVRIPLDPYWSKAILLGFEADIGFETIIVAAAFSSRSEPLFESHRLDNKIVSDSGDYTTFLNLFKNWWSVSWDQNFDSSMGSIFKTVKEIKFILKKEFQINLQYRYHKQFKEKFEEIMFTCFSENLCNYSGHASLGYFPLNSTQPLFIHPGSTIHHSGKYPNFVIFRIIKNNNLIVDVMSISEKTVRKANLKGNFNIQPDSLISMQVTSKEFGPFGEQVFNYIRQFGKLKIKIEDIIKNKNFIFMEYIKKRTFVIYAEGHFDEKIRQVVENIVLKAHSFIYDDEDVVRMQGFYLYFGSGGKISDILMPGEFKEIIIEVGKEYKYYIIETLKLFGENKYNYNTKNENIRFNVIYKTVEYAKKAMHHFSGKKNIKVKPHIHMEGEGEELPCFKIKVAWRRAMSKGYGYIQFITERDFIIAYDKLKYGLSIEGNHVKFEIAEGNDPKLKMWNLPAIIEESTLWNEITQQLPDSVNVKNVYVQRKTCDPVTEDDMVTMRNHLMLAFGDFSSTHSILIDHPKSESTFWNATVYFKTDKEWEKARFAKVKVNAVPAEMIAVIESCIYCPKNIFWAIKEEIESLVNEFNDINLFTEFTGNNVVILLQCKSRSQFFDIHKSLIELVQGFTIDFTGKKEYIFLFFLLNAQKLEPIKKRTGTLICLNKIRKTMSIYGSKYNRYKANNMIKYLAKRTIPPNSKIFNMHSSLSPAIFKYIYKKFGYQLEGITEQYNVIGKLDTFRRKLTLKGSLSDIKQVEQCLEDFLDELRNEDTKDIVNSNTDICGICFNYVLDDYYQLEHCGHTFCNSCLLLQINAKIVPIVCAKQDCGKNLFMLDIKKILNMCEKPDRHLFYDALLQNFISSHRDEFCFCPTPDCQMICRIIKHDTVFSCPCCKNAICTFCQVQYHYGVTCDYFKKTQNDEYYPVKLWMAENKANRKQCPKCMTAIEKNEGCNHMICWNCKSDMCWLCMKLFPHSNSVYEHQPYCPNNQSTNILNQ